MAIRIVSGGGTVQGHAAPFTFDVYNPDLAGITVRYGAAFQRTINFRMFDSIIY